MQKRIILASQSPRRKQFLDDLGLQYEVLPSNIDEEIPNISAERTSPAQMATELARRKAFAVGE